MSNDFQRAKKKKLIDRYRRYHAITELADGTAFESPAGTLLKVCELQSPRQIKASSKLTGNIMIGPDFLRESEP